MQILVPPSAGRHLNCREIKVPGHASSASLTYQMEADRPFPISLVVPGGQEPCLPSKFPPSPLEARTSHQEVDGLLGRVAHIVGGCAVVVARVPGLH